MAKSDDLLIYFCETLTKKIMDRKPIYEKTIMDFSILVANLIRRKTLSKLPDSFQKLTETVEEFWFYSAYKEQDLETSFSYIRIFQIVNMYKVYAADKRIEHEINDDAAKFKKQQRLIQIIYNNPGLTQKDLCRVLKISPANLTKRISNLVQQGYISTSLIGKFTWYSLSYKGLILNKKLSNKTRV